MKGRLYIVKKIYEEPMIVVEQYALTQNVAACETEICFNDNTCVLNDPQATDAMKNLASVGYFNSGYCSLSASGMTSDDGSCYHTNANSSFNS